MVMTMWETRHGAPDPAHMSPRRRTVFGVAFLASDLARSKWIG